MSLFYVFLLSIGKFLNLVSKIPNLILNTLKIVKDLLQLLGNKPINEFMIVNVIIIIILLISTSMLTMIYCVVRATSLIFRLLSLKLGL